MGSGLMNSTSGLAGLASTSGFVQGQFFKAFSTSCFTILCMTFSSGLQSDGWQLPGGPTGPAGPIGQSEGHVPAGPFGPGLPGFPGFPGIEIFAHF